MIRVSLSAQTTPAPPSSVSVTGCHRVQIAGALLAPLASKLPAKTAATADAIRTVQVTTVKMVGTDCSPRPDAPR